MRIILLAASVLLLAGCITPNMPARGASGQDALNARENDDTRTPDVFRKPPRQFGKWGGYGYGERF
ncbi:MAG TPA: hypothetical protein VGM72_08940 [Micropepsaceae bacterium]